MGRVPKSEEAVYGVIGDGRLATHFCHYLKLSNIPFRQWSRKRFPGLPPEAVLGDCDPILIIISDDQIQPFWQGHPALREKRLWHCSGSLTVPGLPSVHPLMTFSRRLYDLETYRGIPLVMEKAEGVEALPGLINPVIWIAPEQKSRYHALCVFSGNLTTLLWQQAFRGFRELGLAPDLLRPYLKQVAENISQDPEGALTGPIARRDKRTIRRNLSALGPPERDIYQAFLRLKEIFL